tara:strand:+ start:27 stop:518 length:492 start_codon:yes stop_codon:yes gene_type:complete
MEYTFYKLSIADKCYIGSTLDLKHRMNQHKSNCKCETSKDYHYKLYQYIRENGCWNDVDITIIETNKCDKEQALDMETKFMLSLNAELNSRYPKRSNKEYIEQHKQIITEYKKKYKENNKQKISEKQKVKIPCDICGKMMSRGSMTRHKKNQHSFIDGNIPQV